VARNSSPQKGGYEPDWTEEELEEKLAELRARGGNKSARLDADLRNHGIELNLDTPYAKGELPDDDDEHLNSKIVTRVKSLMENGEYEELEDLAKVQIIMDPQNAKEWRLIAKRAAKARRRHRPRIVRFFLLLLKIIAVVFAVIVAVGILGALSHH
jgi:predicted house-cleaning noncanonical NTP pyrophosphatase (MazG superfamily)